MFRKPSLQEQYANVSARARTRAYTTASIVFLFASCFFLYTGYQYLAALVALLSLVSFPMLALSDRIVFDGKRLRRTGLAWRISMMIIRRRTRIKPREIIQVETETFRALRPGPNVSYVYRTTFHAADVSFEVGSGRGYRRLLTAVLPLISEACLDVRTLELRDHSADASQVAEDIRRLQIPSSDVLEASVMLDRRKRKSAPTSMAEDREKAEELRVIANQLRTNGRLMQAIEVFRRALQLAPADGRLIYECGRCLHSLAAAKSDERLERKSHAMLRLAERRSGSDGDLLARLGETYFSLGLLDRAEKVFRKAVDAKAAGYRIFRGLGELAMQDGKIAHAINYFAHSAEFAKARPLSRWAQAEADYLRRINDDDEYMEVEIGRINLFDNSAAARRTASRVFLAGLLVIGTGLLLSNNIITDVGWAVSGISMLIWLVASIMQSVFRSRIPFELLDK